MSRLMSPMAAALSSQASLRCVGLMFGPALLGLLADFTSVQAALCANAVILAAVMGFFALAVRSPFRSQLVVDFNVELVFFVAC